MITKKELMSFRQRTGFNVWQIEKDYLQHLFLLFLSHRSKKEFVFKGGTALQKAYGLNRFSIDLDFACEDKNPIESIIRKINEDMNKFGYASEFAKTREARSMTYLFKIKGPLYDGTDKSASPLYVEISLREPILLHAEAKEIIPVYPDISPYICTVMHPEEIMAEKVRAIMSRNKARDVFDMWFLLKKGVNLDKTLVNKKMKYYEMTFDRELFKRAVIAKKAGWKREMSTLLPDVPDFEKIKDELINKVL